MAKNYCIIGSGVAAINAAKAIRDGDPEGNIIIFGAEPFFPYNRIKLSKELYSDLESPKVFIKKEKWYNDQNIELRLNTRITEIDSDRRIIKTNSSESIHYDKLLIATGAKNRKLAINGIDKKGVFTIRERQEAEEFKSFVENKHHVVNIGGGVQGLETAWSLHRRGKKVSIVEAAPRLMARQLDEKTSNFLKSKLENAGVDVYLNTTIDEIIGGSEVEGVMLQGQVLSCDTVLYSIGVIPNLDVVKNTAIATNGGIVVNDAMETNIEHVYAAGDVAEWNGEVAGLWAPAMEQGKIAGKNMTALYASYQRSIPITVFNAFDLSLFSMGLIDEKQCEHTITETDGNDQYTRLFIKNGKIIGVISLEGIVACMPYKTAIESGSSLAGIDVENISINDLMNELKERQKLTA